MCLINWKLHFLRSFFLKFSPQNAENRILGLWNFKILWGRTHANPLPPKKKGTNGPLLIQSFTLFTPAGYFNFYWNPCSMEFLQLRCYADVIWRGNRREKSAAMKFGLLDFCLVSPVLRFSGIVRWGNEIQRILDDGRLLLQQTRAQDITSPITVLLEGWYQLFLLTEVKLATRGTKTRLSDRFCSYQPMQRKPEFGF